MGLSGMTARLWKARCSAALREWGRLFWPQRWKRVSCKGREARQWWTSTQWRTSPAPTWLQLRRFAALLRHAPGCSTHSGPSVAWSVSSAAWRSRNSQQKPRQMVPSPALHTRRTGRSCAPAETGRFSTWRGGLPQQPQLSTWPRAWLWQNASLGTRAKRAWLRQRSDRTSRCKRYRRPTAALWQRHTDSLAATGRRVVRGSTLRLWGNPKMPATAGSCWLGCEGSELLKPAGRSGRWSAIWAHIARCEKWKWLWAPWRGLEVKQDPRQVCCGPSSSACQLCLLFIYLWIWFSAWPGCYPRHTWFVSWRAVKFVKSRNPPETTNNISKDSMDRSSIGF